MSMKAEVKIFVQRNQMEEIVGAPQEENLQEVLKGTMRVGFHVPSEFSDELEKLIKEKQEDLIGKKLWLAVLLFDNDGLLRPEPLIINSPNKVVSEIGWNAAYMVRTRQAYDGTFLFIPPTPASHTI